MGMTFSSRSFEMTNFSQSPWSRCIANPSAPPPDDAENEDEEEDEEEDQDPKGRRFRAVTMSSKQALRPDGRSDSELSASSVSKDGSVSEYRNVTRPFKACPDASLTVIFDSLPSESTPLAEVDSVEVRGRFDAGSPSGAPPMRCSSLGQRA